MSSVNERVRMVRDDARLSRNEFAERIGITANALYMIETGRRGPSPALIREVGRQFSVREAWLLSGEGEMHRDLSPAMEAADRVRRLLVDAPASPAAAVLSTLIFLDPAGPEWEALAGLLRSVSEKMK